MSYNTSRILFLEGSLTITTKKIKSFEDKFDFPIGQRLQLSPLGGGVHAIGRLPSGECGLGRDLPDFLKLTRGSADILVVWEGGDHINAYRAKDGEVEEMDVAFVLKKKAVS